MDQFNTSSSYFSNEAIINALGGNILAWKEDNEQDATEAEEESSLEEYADISETGEVNFRLEPSTPRSCRI